MAERLELVALALPVGRAPGSLQPSFAAFMAACWPEMSRARLLDRARSLALGASQRARPEPGSDGTRLYALVLIIGGVKAELVAHVRRMACEGVAAVGAGCPAGWAFLEKGSRLASKPSRDRQTKQ